MLRTILLSTVSLGLMALATGTAFAEIRAVDASPFTSASFDSQLIGSIVVGGPQSITIEADNSGDLDDVRFEVTNGLLRVWRTTDFGDVLALRGGDVKVTITVPSLEALSANAASRIEAHGMTGESVEISVSSSASLVARDITAHSMRVEASSAGMLVLAGTCETVHVEMSSAAQIAAGTLECVDISINGSSASRALLFASGNVTADVSSAAQIELAGHPRHVDDEVNSGADVNILE